MRTFLSLRNLLWKSCTAKAVQSAATSRSASLTKGATVPMSLICIGQCESRGFSSVLLTGIAPIDEHDGHCSLISVFISYLLAIFFWCSCIHHTPRMHHVAMMY